MIIRGYENITYAYYENITYWNVGNKEWNVIFIIMQHEHE